MTDDQYQLKCTPDFGFPTILPCGHNVADPRKNPACREANPENIVHAATPSAGYSWAHGKRPTIPWEGGMSTRAVRPSCSCVEIVGIAARLDTT